MWGGRYGSSQSKVRGYSMMIWVFIAVAIVNALFPHLAFGYALAIGVPLGAAGGAGLGYLMGYLLTPKAVRDEERPQS